MTELRKECRLGCAACCIAPSITTSIPGMPSGKPAGMRCANLTSENLCTIHGKTDYPFFCKGLKPSEEMCGDSDVFAMAYLAGLEEKTAEKQNPDRTSL